MATSPTNDTYGVPWQDDDSVQACPQCQREFSIFTRRHHCRFCGSVVCARCSKEKKIHPKTNKREIICELCVCETQRQEREAAEAAAAAEAAREAELARLAAEKAEEERRAAEAAEAARRAEEERVAAEAAKAELLARQAVLAEQVLVRYNEKYGAKDACGTISSLEDQNHRGATALFCAVKYGEDPEAESYKSDCRGDVEIVRMLLEAGADVEARGEGNSTALHEAAWKGHVENVEALLEARSDVNAHFSWRRRKVTPLQKAAEGSRSSSFQGRDWEAVIRLLREHGGVCHDPTCEIPFSE